MFLTFTYALLVTSIATLFYWIDCLKNINITVYKKQFTLFLDFIIIYSRF
jgi:hypothetical protein